jgi:hypothetical protein
LLLLLLLAGPGAVAQVGKLSGRAGAVSSLRSSPSSSTQVSFDPPPREELTIIEPSIIATRLRPPGTMLIVSPKTAKGRRSTWRGTSLPPPSAVGIVDRRTTSCAIHLSGERRMTSARPASVVASVAGPMNTPLPPDSPVGLKTSSSIRFSAACIRSGSDIR